METESNSAQRVRVERGVTLATIHHPPINLVEGALIANFGGADPVGGS
jgi:hypothetical protein